MKFSPATLFATISQLTARRNFYVAYSGGVDSHVLLHALATPDKELLSPCPPFSVTAVHINHGIHRDADLWEEHCRSECAKLKVACIVKRVAVNFHLESKGHAGMEAVARKLRYQALCAIVPHDAVLLTAHHADDQVETLLLQLLRGAGPKGLAAISPQSYLGNDGDYKDGCYHATIRTELLRPLLPYARSELLRYAAEQQLQWKEDSSNLDITINRNYLRQQIIPLLKERWEGLLQTCGRVATNCYETQFLAEELAKLDCTEVKDQQNCLRNAHKSTENKIWVSPALDVKNPCVKKHEKLSFFWHACPFADLLRASKDAYPTLVISKLLQLSPMRQRNLLRYFFAQLNLSLPSRIKIEEVQRTVLNCADDATSLVKWHGAEVRRYQDKLYAFAPLPLHDTSIVLNWDNLEQPLELPGGLGWLSAQGEEIGEEGSKSKDSYIVRFRHGGERLRLNGKAHSSSLKKLLQEWQIPPWLRDRLPLLYCDEEIVTINLI